MKWQNQKVHYTVLCILMPVNISYIYAMIHPCFFVLYLWILAEKDGIIIIVLHFCTPLCTTRDNHSWIHSSFRLQKPLQTIHRWVYYYNITSIITTLASSTNMSLITIVGQPFDNTCKISITNKKDFRQIQGHEKLNNFAVFHIMA